MGVENDFLVEFTPLVDHAGKRINPFQVCDQFLRHYRRSLRCKTHPPHVLDIEQSVADIFDMFRFEIRHIAPTDDDILQFGPRFDIGKNLLPTLDNGAEMDLFDFFGI